MLTFSKITILPEPLKITLIESCEANSSQLAKLNIDLTQIGNFLHKASFDTRDSIPPNMTILFDRTLKDTDRSINLSNRLLVTSDSTKRGVIRLFDLYSHKHGEIKPHRHFYETNIIFPSEKQSTVEFLIKDLLRRSNAETFRSCTIEELIIQELTNKNILIKNVKRTHLDRFPDALFAFRTSDQRQDSVDMLFITPPVVHPEDLRTDYFETVAAQNSRLKSLKGQPIEQLSVFAQVNQPQTDPDLASKITATGRMNIQTGNIEDTTPREQKEIEGLLQLGLDWITRLRKEFLPK